MELRYFSSGNSINHLTTYVSLYDKSARLYVLSLLTVKQFGYPEINLNSWQMIEWLGQVYFAADFFWKGPHGTILRISKEGWLQRHAGGRWNLFLCTSYESLYSFR